MRLDCRAISRVNHGTYRCLRYGHSPTLRVAGTIGIPRPRTRQPLERDRQPSGRRGRPGTTFRDSGLPTRGGRPPECDRTIPVSGEPARIRPYQPDDLDELYRICVQTADNGHDATSMFRDPLLPGHVYAAPYALFEPSLAFVAQDAGGVGGYIVAALDSHAFEQRLERDWWPALRASHPEPSQDLAKGLSPPEQFALHAIHHPWGTPGDLARGFPSHLHINLVPRLQGQGDRASANCDSSLSPS
jgi:hypothetical protein